MTHSGMAMLVIAGGFGSALFGQQYPQQGPQQYPIDRGAPNDNGQYNNGEYPRDPGFGANNGDPDYNVSDQGVYAPAPPPVPAYAYQRPPMPGPGYYWVDGYWDFVGGRYAWVGGYWMLPPYEGGYWVAPRYVGSRFYLGFWGGGHRGFDRGFVGRDYRYEGRFQAPRQNYAQGGFRGGDYRGGDYRYQGRAQAPGQHFGAPAQRGSSFRGGDNRGDRSVEHGQRGGRR